MQPLAETTLRRPWHWGVALFGRSLSGEVPDRIEGRSVAVGTDVLAIGVRHAQDIDADRYEGDWEWATATFHVRSLVEAEDALGEVLCDVVLQIDDERLSLVAWPEAVLTAVELLPKV